MSNNDKKRLQIGDLVWYNVGGRGHETIGLVIDRREYLWRAKSPWDDRNKRYEDCVRVKWMRRGKYAPKAISVPLYDSEYTLEWTGDPPDAVTVEEMLAYDAEHGAIFQKDWYEARFFKVMGPVKDRA